MSLPSFGKTPCYRARHLLSREPPSGVDAREAVSYPDALANFPADPHGRFVMLTFGRSPPRNGPGSWNPVFIGNSFCPIRLPVEDGACSFGDAGMRNKAFDATVIMVLPLVALAVAYVCFEVLYFQADDESQEVVLQGRSRPGWCRLPCSSPSIRSFGRAATRTCTSGSRSYSRSSSGERRTLPASRPRWPSGRGSYCKIPR